MNQFTSTINRFGVGLLGLLLFGTLRAQNEGSALLANFGYGYFEPFEDLSTRFGGFHSAGVGLDYLTANNFIFGARGDFFYGNNVKENTLADARNELGFIYGTGGEPAVVSLKMRGISGFVYVGKLFQLGEADARRGIRVTLGGGVLQHKIRIQNDPQMPTPQFSDEYTAGYDRQTNGFALTQTLGYQFLAANRRTNFYLGLELTEGFTANRRNANFYQSPNAKNDGRLDVIVGLRGVWTLPFYFGTAGTEKIFY